MDIQAVIDALNAGDMHKAATLLNIAGDEASEAVDFAHTADARIGLDKLATHLWDAAVDICT